MNQPDPDRITQRIESSIERGIRNGDFDNLPGAGKPLDLGNPHDENWWIKKYAQREKLDLGAALPGTAGLRKRSLEFRDTLPDYPSAQAVQDAVQELNAAIIADRKKVYLNNPFPVAAPELDETEMVRAWHKLQRKHRTATTSAPPDAADSAQSAPSRKNPLWRRWFGHN